MYVGTYLPTYKIHPRVLLQFISRYCAAIKITLELNLQTFSVEAKSEQKTKKRNAKEIPTTYIQ